MLHPRTMEGLLAYQDVDWDIRSGDFVSVDSGSLDPELITRRCDAMLLVYRGRTSSCGTTSAVAQASLPPEDQA